jgi:hypothetical protein
VTDEVRKPTKKGQKCYSMTIWRGYLSSLLWV